MLNSLSKRERYLLSVAAGTSLVLRAIAFFHYRFDSDEQQHLHVAWGWTAGLVQYRDYFDNHAPLFHLLMAPLLALLGERATILLWMRIPMLFTFAFALYATWKLGRQAYGDRVSLWAVTLLSLFPPFFLKSLEFRTDNLWTGFALAALLLLARGFASRPSSASEERRRMFFVGLLLGCALATSLKTLLLIATFAAAAVLTRLFVQRSIRFHGLLPALAGLLIVPGVIAVGFALAGAWRPLVYCNFTFNANLARTRDASWILPALFPFAIAAILVVAWRQRRAATPFRFFLALTITLFIVTLSCFWILISPRDFLPMMPLLAIFAAAALLRSSRPLAALGMVCAICIAGIYRYTDLFENRTDWHTTLLDQVLGLTRPGEPLLDIKGETIYRPRPTYSIFENITRAQIAHGIMRDTVEQDVIRTRTHVAQADGPMWPPAARAFLTDHFVDVGRLRASGQWLTPDGSFTIAVPGDYVVLGEDGEVSGALDGTPYRGARALAPGRHQFLTSGTDHHLVVFWAPAFQRGYSPFHLRDREF